MTLLPTDSWNVKPRLDLPAYELNEIDPVTGDAATEDHHIWRRSFTALGKENSKLFWVELGDGTVVPNRVKLCHDVHEDLTQNRARLVYLEDQKKFVFVDLEDENVDAPTMLLFQPGPPSEPMQTTVTGEEIPHRHVVDEDGVEEECPRCHGEGKIKKKSKPSEENLTQAPERRKVTWSVRVPKDEQENGYEILDSLMDAAVERMHELGLIRDKNRGANYYTLLAALRGFVLGEDLGSDG